MVEVHYLDQRGGQSRVEHVVIVAAHPNLRDVNISDAVCLDESLVIDALLQISVRDVDLADFLEVEELVQGREFGARAYHCVVVVM